MRYALACLLVLVLSQQGRPSPPHLQRAAEESQQVKELVRELEQAEAKLRGAEKSAKNAWSAVNMLLWAFGLFACILLVRKMSADSARKWVTFRAADDELPDALKGLGFRPKELTERQRQELFEAMCLLQWYLSLALLALKQVRKADMDRHAQFRLIETMIGKFLCGYQTAVLQPQAPHHHEIGEMGRLLAEIELRKPEKVVKQLAELVSRCESRLESRVAAGVQDAISQMDLEHRSIAVEAKQARAAADASLAELRTAERAAARRLQDLEKREEAVRQQAELLERHETEIAERERLVREEYLPELQVTRDELRLAQEELAASCELGAELVYDWLDQHPKQALELFAELAKHAAERNGKPQDNIA